MIQKVVSKENPEINFPHDCFTWGKLLVLVADPTLLGAAQDLQSSSIAGLEINICRDNSTDLVMVMGALYGSCIFLCFTNCGAVQPVVSIERTVFYREKAAGLYAAMPYALGQASSNAHLAQFTRIYQWRIHYAKFSHANYIALLTCFLLVQTELQVIVEIPYVFVQVLMYASVTYAMIGFEWTAAKFFWYLYILFFGVLAFTYYGMMMVSLTPNATLATICASFFYAVFNLFSGFLIARPVCALSPQNSAFLCKL